MKWHTPPLLLLALWPVMGSCLVGVPDPTDNADLGALRGQVRPMAEGQLRVVEATLAEAQGRRHTTLALAKFHLLGGEPERARHLLAAMARGNPGTLAPVLSRYRATTEFLLGDWTAARKLLDDPALLSPPHLGRVCLLKTLLQVALRERANMRPEWARCKAENPTDAAQRDMLWMDALVDMAAGGGPPPGLGRGLRLMPNDELKRTLKLALYLHREDLVEADLDFLDASVVEDDELRALIAHVHYRRGRLARAWGFMQDLATPNVENMKGNLWLLRQNQELAYAQFKLALKLKANSHNAAERALPLAWVLKQWQDGTGLAERLDAHQGNRQQQKTLAAAFAIQRADWDGARTRLGEVSHAMGSGTPLEVEQLSAYVALRTRDLPGVERHGQRACAAGDLVACWTLSAQVNWQDFTPLLERAEGSAPTSPLWRELSRAETVEPFREPATVEQRDIEELDDSLIKLVK